MDYYCKEAGSRIFLCLIVTVILKENPNARAMMFFKINRNDDETKIVISLLSQISETY
jgi:hypothetical protein